YAPQVPTPPPMPASPPVGYAPPMAPMSAQQAPPIYPAPTWPGGPGPLTQQSPRRLGVVLAISGIAVVGITIAVVLVARRSDTPAPARPASSYTPVAEAPRVDAGVAELPPSADPWAPPSSSSPSRPPAPPAPAHYDVPLAAGKKVGVGQGVSLVVPPGFRVTTNNGATIVFDPRGVAIAAGPITGEGTDVEALAQEYARGTGLTLEKWGTAFVGGVQRQMSIFHGYLQGVEVRQFGVALIGRGYRIGVVFSTPARVASDPSVQKLLLELWPRRIVLP
ncbi:MAG TPA: hypothetical protein VF469_37030, partial [Kofleriaceae bacterium]